MSEKIVRASTPGSMILFGEHSVLRGKHALVLAIARRLTTTLETRSDRLIQIESPLGNLRANLDQFHIQAPFSYVLQTFQDLPPASGLNLTITSDISATMGFGTSAAVVVALVGALRGLEKIHSEKELIFTQALDIVRKVQGMGSGADVMASLRGGVGLYQEGVYQPLLSPRLLREASFFGAYSGFKTPTAEVVSQVAQQFSDNLGLLRALDQANDALTLQAATCLENPHRLGLLMNIGSGLMESFGVHTKALTQWLWDLREHSHGVKLSGSGLGDCAIGVPKNGILPPGSFPIHISDQGLIVERLR